MHPFRRIAVTTIVAASVFGAVACGGSAQEVGGDRIVDAAAGDDTADNGVYSTEDENTVTSKADEDEGDSSESADSNGEEADDSADPDIAEVEVGGEPADVEEVLPRIVSDVAQHEMSETETTCMISETESNPEIRKLVDSYDNPAVSPEQTSVYEFSLAMQRCIAADALAFQISQGWGFIGQDEAVPVTLDTLDDTDQATVDCFASQIEGPDGSAIYAAMFIRLIQFEPDPAANEPTIAAMTECAPTSAIAANMGGTVEAASGFTSTVDLECAAEAIESKKESFWRYVIASEGTGFEEVETAIGECTTELDDGLLDAPPDSWVPWSGDHTLAEVTPRARNDIYSEAPEMTIDPDGSYTAVIKTGAGEIRLALDAKNSPITVNNFVSLANDGFYDGLTFHRVLDGFMAQGGDPLGTGSGGPGYVFEDEVDNGLVFDKAGQLAMANSGPGTNGSQFFITFDATDFLNGDHTIFGEVIEGEDVLNAIERRNPEAAQGLGQVIESITIIEGE